MKFLVTQLFAFGVKYTYGKFAETELIVSGQFKVMLLSIARM